MKAYLLDVNVLVALAWPEHVSHHLVRQWFQRHASRGWATCPLVQAGFVRIVCNPAFSHYAVSVEQALHELHNSLQDKFHQFWPDSLPVPQALQEIGPQLSGHQQITDAYLVALAAHRQGKLATLDRAIAQFAPEHALEIIR